MLHVGGISGSWQKQVQIPFGEIQGKKKGSISILTTKQKTKVLLSIIKGRDAHYAVIIKW